MPHVVLISVDGLRPDVMDAARAPNIARLAAEGIASWSARAAEPTETLPNHLTLATGQSPARHGVTDDEVPWRRLHRPTIFSRVRAANGPTAFYFGKGKLAWLASNGAVDVLRGPGAGSSTWRATSRPISHAPASI